MDSPNIEELEDKTSRYPIVRSDPKMMEISLYEIKDLINDSFLEKILTEAGAILLGGIISAVISGVAVSSIIIIISFAWYVFSHIYFYWTKKSKIKQLESRGTGKWR